jgi:hypothetical protein
MRDDHIETRHAPRRYRMVRDTAVVRGTIGCEVQASWGLRPHVCKPTGALQHMANIQHLGHQVTYLVDYGGDRVRLS